MKRFALLPLILLFAVAAASQTQRPSASPTPPADEPDVVKITTSLIQVDVTVLDSRGKIITDLKPEEIEIYENGKKQSITNFSFVSNVRERVEQPNKVEKNAPVVPTTPLKQENVRRTVALVVDDLTLSFESVYYVRRALTKFVDEQMQEGDLVAIIRAGAGIGALQQFTSDKRMLYAAIEKVRWNPSGAGGIGAFAPLEAKPPATEPSPEPGPGDRTDEGREREFNDFRTNYFVTGTLGAVNYVVRGMAELPGRKSIMLLSDGFKLFNKDAGGSIESSRIMASLRSLIDQANRSSVVIYTLDARGLQVTGLTAADNTQGRTPEEIRQEESDRNAELRDTQDGLVFLAQETGGFAIINNNDLASGIRRVLDDQSYYLVGYEPEGETFDPKTRRFNRLNIKVLRKGARVRYRSGFFGVSDDNVAKNSSATRGNLVQALTSPFAVNEIAVRLNTMFGVEKGQTPFVRSLLHVAAKDISFADTPDGKKVATFEVLAIGFGDNGLPVDQVAKSYTMTLTKERYDQFLRFGFVYDIAFPVKKPGAYQLRIALKDTATNKIGSANQYIDVPNLKKNHLTLSGLVIENLSEAAYSKRVANNGVPAAGDSQPLIDTALRQFKPGTILNFGMAVHNYKLASGLTSKVSLYKDGKIVFTGEPNPLTFQAVDGAMPFMSSLGLPKKMELGEYALQVDITDTNIKGRHRTATQFIQFEIVE
ncbi:MAG: VWA domain-containing protein [Pyrinomonadaceae bacterium]